MLKMAKLIEDYSNLKSQIKSQFPEVIEWSKNSFLSDLKWKVVSKKKWDRKRASEFQTAVGYAPEGYGGPYKFQDKQNSDGTFTSTWNSGASS